MNIRDWLSQELVRRKWSHREFARQSGISQTQISAVLAGERKGNADFCIKAAIALDIPPEKLLRLAGILPGEPTESAASPIAQEIINLIHNMPLEQRKEALRYIRYLSQSSGQG